jgi:hypothetical protein
MPVFVHSRLQKTFIMILIVVFLVIMLCGLVDGYQCIGGFGDVPPRL